MENEIGRLAGMTKPDGQERETGPAGGPAPPRVPGPRPAFRLGAIRVNPIDLLPTHLVERARIVDPRSRPDLSSASPSSGPVLWWVHHAMRVEENPALDVAAELAASLEVPLQPVAVVGGRHRHNNDRHTLFALEGLRDLQADLRAAGLDLAVFARGTGQDSVIAPLARDASVVVTEEMPAAPWPQWMEAIASVAASGGTPLVAVDASCVVPMSLSRKAPDRAFVFRDRFEGERRGRMVASWLGGRREVAAASPLEGSIELAGADDRDLSRIVAGLDVDHAVGPVFDTPGGARAGEARWRAFRAKGLRRYGRDRNDAAIDGVSRMSAYLHYGMVSPFRIAREACRDNASKYLDELLIWREIAWHWAFHRPHHESLDALPKWAVRTLAEHRGDPRDRIDDETLARGVVGEPLWDLAQRSLLRQGELHNNVRMTWGKAIPGWSASPEEAIGRLFELNNRFALDGCDPSSAGGLLWCLGLFDRPFEPERPVLGAVRGRDIADHAGRLDLAAFERRVSRPQRIGADGAPLRVAVVGAGVCGLAAARTLADHGVRVAVFDKGRGPGGRISTRRGTASRFDHGAASFVAGDPRFRRIAEAWCELGIVAPWQADLVRCDASGAGVETRSLAAVDELVGVGGMNRIAKHLAEDLEVSCGARVERLERESDGRWTLHLDGREAGAAWDAVIVAIPPEQAAGLLLASGIVPSDAGMPADASVSMTPAWVAMIETTAPIVRRFGRLETPEEAPWRSIVDQGSKPGRGETPGTAFVLEAGAAWALAHLEADREDAARMLGEVFASVIASWSGEDVEIATCAAHRWRFARPVRRVAEAPSAPSRVELGSSAVVAGGDHRRSGTVEGAWLAGIDLAGSVLRDPRWAIRPGFDGDCATESEEGSLF